MKDIIVLIPSLEPTEDFIKFIKQLSKDFKNIIVVNDGSSKEYNYIFEKVSENAIVLKHKENKGKGRALKTGFEYIKKHYNEKTVGVVTADSDGQHSISDIKKIATKLKKHPNTLILGKRNFNLKSVPFTNKFGNKMTRFVLYFATGLKIYDTQTGLRGYGYNDLDMYLKIPGERFEYEMNTLIYFAKHNLKILEVGIETIYSRVNYVSHFSFINDSISVYKNFLLYVIWQLTSFALELVLFFYLYKTIPQDNWGVLLFVTLISKTLGFLALFLIERNYSKVKVEKTIIEFEMLLFSIIVSTLLVYFIRPLKLFKLLKILIELLLIVVTSRLKNYRAFKNQ